MNEAGGTIAFGARYGQTRGRAQAASPDDSSEGQVREVAIQGTVDADKLVGENWFSKENKAC